MPARPRLGSVRRAARPEPRLCPRAAPARATPSPAAVPSARPPPKPQHPLFPGHDHLSVQLRIALSTAYPERRDFCFLRTASSRPALCGACEPLSTGQSPRPGASGSHRRSTFRPRVGTYPTSSSGPAAMTPPLGHLAGWSARSLIFAESSDSASTSTARDRLPEPAQRAAYSQRSQPGTALTRRDDPLVCLWPPRSAAPAAG